jgi:hypothetical protein
MGNLLDKFKAEVTRTGESITFTKLGGSAGSFARDVIVTVADAGTLNAHFDSITLSGFNRPLLKGIVAGDNTVAVNDTFSRDSKNFTVRSVFKTRIGTEVVNILFLASWA